MSCKVSAPVDILPFVEILSQFVGSSIPNSSAEDAGGQALSSYRELIDRNGLLNIREIEQGTGRISLLQT